MTPRLPEPGEFYEHYKGGKYVVLCLAKHTETSEQMVIYRNLEHDTIWARPLSVWKGSPSDSNLPRFRLLSGGSFGSKNNPVI